MNEPPLRAPGALVRPATVADAAALGAMRAAQQAELAGGTAYAAGIAAYADACTAFFARELGRPDAWVLGWIATAGTGTGDAADAAPAGSAVLTLAPGMPRFEPGRSGHAHGSPDGRIRSIYVVPAARRRGLARALTLAAIAEAERRGVGRLMLGASDAGRPLYEALGFVAKGDEMVYAPAAAPEAAV